MAEDRRGVENFYSKLKLLMSDGGTLRTDDIYKLFPDVKKNTVSWYLYKLRQDKKILRLEHGVYSFLRPADDVVQYGDIQNFSRKLYDSMQEYSDKFYISGLDALVRQMHHVPEQYPAIMVARREAFGDIRERFAQDAAVISSPDEARLIMRGQYPAGRVVVLVKGGDFSLACNNIAMPEKGFIDLYYAVTRMFYPLSAQEMLRIFRNLRRSKSFSRSKLLSAANDAGVGREALLFDSVDRMSPEAADFAKLLLEEAGQR